MADSTGVNAETGKPLSDWQHVQQSIRKILTTPLNSRVMRRDFGSRIPDLVDSKMVSRNVLAVYAAAAIAIDRWEPRFRISRCRVPNLTVSGILQLEIYGTYFPRGHLGDYSVAEDASVRVVFEGAI